MKDKKSQEEIIQGFNTMRNEQRSIAAKINELQQDLNEHKIVIETLEGVDADRKCFRLVFSNSEIMNKFRYFSTGTVRYSKF
jgi:prefoldin subunit 2